MPKLLIFDAFTLLIRKKNVANYAFLRCKTFSLKIWLCKIFDKYHVCSREKAVWKKNIDKPSSIFQERLDNIMGDDVKIERKIYMCSSLYLHPAKIGWALGNANSNC